MKDYKEIEMKINDLGVEKVDMSKVLELRSYYVSKLNPKNPNQNPNMFNKFLEIERYVLKRYSILKNKFDYICKEKDINRNEIFAILESNNLSANLFIENDIVSLKKLINELEVQYA